MNYHIAVYQLLPSDATEYVTTWTCTEEDVEAMLQTLQDFYPGHELRFEDSEGKVTIVPPESFD